ncbi:restriction endonuclease subunit S [soil metagenome]
MTLINGTAFKPTEWSEEGLPIVRIQNLNNSQAGFNKYSGQRPEKFRLYGGELLFAWSGTPGTSFGAHIWRGEDAWLNQHIFNVKFDEREWDKRFLQLAINQNLAEYIRAAHGGAGLAHITKGRFEDSVLLQPSLGDQREIVAEIDKQFSRLDAGLAALKRAQANLKRYRAAVLNSACEGKLVPTEAELAAKEGRVYETGEELLKRILDERRRSWQRRGKYMEPSPADTLRLPTLPDGWAWASIAELGEIQLGRQRSPKNISKDSPTKYIRAGNITERGLDLEQVFEMEFTASERERFALQDGDILLSEASGSASQVGKPAVWRSELPLCCFQNTVLRLRPMILSENFVLLVFQHFYANQIFARLAGGVGINHLGAERFSEIPFPVPPLAEQKRIVAGVERVLSAVDSLGGVARANMDRSMRLRSSILDRVFGGEAVPG